MTKWIDQIVRPVFCSIRAKVPTKRQTAIGLSALMFMMLPTKATDNKRQTSDSSLRVSPYELTGTVWVVHFPNKRRLTKLLKVIEKILLAIECFCRKIYSKVWYYRIVFTTNLTRKNNVRRSKRRN